MNFNKISRLVIVAAGFFAVSWVRAAPPKTIVVALAANLTALSDNMWNPFADNFRKGIYLALSEMEPLLAKKGLKIVVREFDIKNDKEAAANAAQQIAQSDASATIGFPYSSELFLAAPILSADKMILLSPSATADRISELAPYVRTTAFSDRFQGKLLAKFAAKRKIRTIGIISVADCAYCQSLRVSLRENLTRMNGKVVFDESQLDSDLQSKEGLDRLAHAVKTIKADSIAVLGYERLSAVVISGLYDRGIRPETWLGGDGWGAANDLFLKIIGSRSIDGYTLAHWHPSLPSQASRAFVKAFAKKYGRQPMEVAPVAYESMEILLRAIINAPTKDRAGILSSLQAIRQFEGITGRISFLKEENQAHKEAVFLRIKGGKVSLQGKVRE